MLLEKLKKETNEYIKECWVQSINLHIEDLYVEVQFIFEDIREKRDYVLKANSLHRYIKEDLPKLCEDARNYCPEEVEKLEDAIKMVEKYIYPLRII